MSDEQNTDPRAPAQPMSPERLDNIRQHVTGGGDGLCKSEARDLLADRDRLAALLASILATPTGPDDERSGLDLVVGDGVVHGGEWRTVASVDDRGWLVFEGEDEFAFYSDSWRVKFAREPERRIKGSSTPYPGRRYHMPPTF